MKYLSLFVFSMLLISLLGCTVEEQVEQEPVIEQPAPVGGEVAMEIDDTPETPEEETAPPAEPEEEPEPEVIEVTLTPEKTMVPSELNIKKGTIVVFTNEDYGFNHNLIIYYTDIGLNSNDDVIIQSGNIGEGDSWEIKFKDVAEYSVKDIYSGSMRGEITAEVTRMTPAELMEEGLLIGKIIVE